MSGLYLASNSPRRHELLDQVGMIHSIVASTYEEANDISQMSVADLVESQALGKARCAVGVPQDGIIIGADTIVVKDGKILGKPSSQEEAKAMLRSLSGRQHAVLTGVAIKRGPKEVVFHVTTRVIFRRLMEEEIQGYVASGEPLDKAGAYGIQGIGALWVEGIEGSYTNVVGLPVERVYEELKKFLSD